MDANDLFKLATDINAQKAAEVRGMSDEDWRHRSGARVEPLMAHAVVVSRMLSQKLGVICQAFDENEIARQTLPNVLDALADCERMAYALRSDIERLAR